MNNQFLVLTNEEHDEFIYDYLKDNPLTLDELVENLYEQYYIKEKDTKLAVQRLRYAGKIGPNNRWQMAHIPTIKI